MSETKTKYKNQQKIFLIKHLVRCETKNIRELSG